MLPTPLHPCTQPSQVRHLKVRSSAPAQPWCHGKPLTPSLAYRPHPRSKSPNEARVPWKVAWMAEADVMLRAEGQPLWRSAHLSPRPSPQQSLAPVVTCSRGLCSFPCLSRAGQAGLQKGPPSQPPAPGSAIAGSTEGREGRPSLACERRAKNNT